MKKYYVIGFFILLCALFAYHFYAAENAEENIDTSIQEITSSLKPPLSVSYSSMEVSPFSGDITFRDLNIIRDQDIRRARSLRFDFSYLDFVNISLFGPEYGLKKIGSGNIIFDRLSFTNRARLTEIKLDSLYASYSGDLWDLLRSAYKDTATVSTHNLRASGRQFTLSRPDDIGIIKADTLFLENSLSDQSNQRSLSGNGSFHQLTWNPPASFGDRYRFFIQGFGYQADSIPFREAEVDFAYDFEDNRLSISNMNLSSELFTGTLAGDLQVDSASIAGSSIENATIRFNNLSPQLQNVLSNAEKLFGIKIPMADGNLSMGVSGTLAKPTVILSGN
jgi:hypothetical protein